MKGLVITSKGIEDTAAIEIKELINAECKTEEGCVIFNFSDISQLCLLCYKSQSVDRVLYLICSFEFKNFFEDFEKFCANSDFNEWIGKYKKFKVECLRLGTHEFNSVEVEKKTGHLILKKSKNRNIKVDIRNYEIIFFVYIINNKCYFGVDFAGFELNKRGYKIFIHSNSLRGAIAYGLIIESGFKKNEVMLDPFSRDGVIAIEAAFYAIDFPCNYYRKDKFAFLKLNLDLDFEKFFAEIDRSIKKSKSKIYCLDFSFKFINYSRKNSQCAGVEKHLNFSRTELEWLDIKFEKESVDRIVTSLPTSKNKNIDKIYNEFFYQSSYILKNNGTIALITRLPNSIKDYASKHNLLSFREKDVWAGEQLLKILVFKKKSI